MTMTDSQVNHLDLCYSLLRRILFRMLLISMWFFTVKHNFTANYKPMGFILKSYLVQHEKGPLSPHTILIV